WGRTDSRLRRTARSGLAGASWSRLLRGGAVAGRAIAPLHADQPSTVTVTASKGRRPPAGSRISGVDAGVDWPLSLCDTVPRTVGEPTMRARGPGGTRRFLGVECGEAGVVPDGRGSRSPT